MKLTTPSAALAFLTCVTLLSTTEVSAAKELRCQCVKIYSGKPINPKQIEKVQMIRAGSHCKNVQIIATMKKGPLCLNPKDEWVKKILEK